MDNLTLNQQQNRTTNFCNETYSTIRLVLNFILVFFGFPTTIIIIAKILNKIYKTRSYSAAEIFLLQISFTNVFLFTSLFLCFLNDTDVIQFSVTILKLLYSPYLTARPIFILAMCVTFYLAIVHPVTYMNTKAWLHWMWLVITLVWIYSLAINLVIIFNNYDFSHPVFVAMLLISLPITMCFNFSTLRALTSTGPGNNTQTLNPAKREAFRIILSIQVVLLMFYIPRTYLYIYRFIIPVDMQMFMCTEGAVMMLATQFSDFAMSVIFLYSLGKLGV